MRAKETDERRDDAGMRPGVRWGRRGLGKSGPAKRGGVDGIHVYKERRKVGSRK